MAELIALAPALFWTALALLIYVYLGYPAIAWARRQVWPRAVARAPIEPSVTVIVVAHNEGDRIRRRLENLLESDYPRGRLSILVGSDGSSDDTVERAARYEGEGVRVCAFAARRGKAAVLNDLVGATDGEIVVFADARQRFERGAIRALVASFADPAVGAVSGELHLTRRRGTSPCGEGNGFYWRYEKFIRASESGSGSTVGATGAIYAIRRRLYDPIPPDTILDDVLIPMRIVQKGYRVLFEPRALASDLISTTPREDFVRKARTIAGTFQLFAREPWMMDPRRSPVWFQALSHKALRLTIPLLHIALFGANLLLVDRWPYGLLFGGQVLFYAAAAIGCLQLRSQRRIICFTVPYTMCLLGWATVVGLARFVAGRQPAAWDQAYIQKRV